MHEVQGEDLDTADNSREGTNYGGTNGEPTDTEKQVLGKGRERSREVRRLGGVNPTYSGPTRTPGWQARREPGDCGEKGME
jgi:hypothetical protein